MANGDMRYRDLKITLDYLQGKIMARLAEEHSVSHTRISNIVSKGLRIARHPANTRGAIMPSDYTPKAALKNKEAWIPIVERLVDEAKATRDKPDAPISDSFKYQVIEAETVEELGRRVTTRLDIPNWKTTGGVERIGGFYTQAVVFDPQPKVEHYILVQNADQESFLSTVRWRLTEGWTPQGGVVMTHVEQPSMVNGAFTHTKLLYTQAMVK